MGFFDNIVKSFNEGEIKDGLSQIGKGLDKVVKDVGNEINKSGIKEDLKKIGRDLGSSPKVIPEEYQEFPKFESKIDDLYIKKIDKYHRCTIDYYNVTDESVNKYISLIEEKGFRKGSDIRYDKNNTYIILEHIKDKLHLVFHVRH